MTKFGGSVLVPEGTTTHITKPPILKSLRTVAFLSASNLDSQVLLSSPKLVPSVQPQQRQAEARTALTEEFSCHCLSGHMGAALLVPFCWLLNCPEGFEAWVGVLQCLLFVLLLLVLPF